MHMPHELERYLVAATKSAGSMESWRGRRGWDYDHKRGRAALGQGESNPMSLNDVAQIGSVAAAGFGVFAWFQYRLFRHQIALQLMGHVHDRYSSLYKELASLPAGEVKYAELTMEQRNAISAYINLCSEQFYWRGRPGLVDNAVWQVWNTAIGEKLREPAIRAAWEANHQHDVYYDGFCEYVRNHIQARTVA